jgi:hypothetical protein
MHSGFVRVWWTLIQIPDGTGPRCGNARRLPTLQIGLAPAGLFDEIASYLPDGPLPALLRWFGTRDDIILEALRVATGRDTRRAGLRVHPVTSCRALVARCPLWGLPRSACGAGGSVLPSRRVRSQP